MSNTTPQQYSPGDAVGGHILGLDGQWSPVPPAPNEKKPVWRRWYAIAGYVVVGLMIIGTLSGGGETEKADADKPAAAAPAKPKAEKPAAEQEPVAEEEAPDPKPEPKPKPAEPKAIKVTAKQILDEFEGNEAAADAKYDGKTLAVTGVVDKVDTEFWNDEQYTIQLSDGDEWAIWTVNFNDMSGDEAAKVKVGSTITMAGEFDDGGDLGVEMKNGHLG